jgi:NAD(P)H-hydrate epimerase
MLSHFGDLRGSKVGIVCGKGNNGGDGYVIGRYLAARDVPVTVYLLCDITDVAGDAKEHLQLLTRMDVPVVEIRDTKELLHHKSAMLLRDIWVDAIFGTGLKSEVSGIFKSVIGLINSLGKPVFSVDIPSGLHPDTGQPLGDCICAEATATFGFAKTGMVLYPGAGYCGRIGIVDIGIPPHIAKESLLSCHLLTPDDITKTYLKRSVDSHKGSYGHLLVIAGSKGKTGAAALCSEAAMRIGAGLVTLGCPSGTNMVLETLLREVMTCPLPDTKDGTFSKGAVADIRKIMEGKDCLAIGPGIGVDDLVVQMVHELISGCDIPLVLDADALNCLEGHARILKEAGRDVVLTPHPKEMARLTGKTVGDIQGDRIGHAVAFAEKFRVHVVLKGARTVIAHPDGQVYVNPTGNPVLSSGGTGDVLTGMIAGLICQGYGVKEACHLGVYLHGTAADTLLRQRGPAGILASDLIQVLPETLRDTETHCLEPVSWVSRDL